MSSVRKNTVVGVVALSLPVMFARPVFSHCQVPCGIYGDEMRFVMIAENIRTIEKSMKQINELSKQQDKNWNQIVRWVQNKEKHADDTSRIITYYFLAQRVKPVDKKDAKAYNEYVRKLTLLHEMLIYAMKSKQTTDLGNAAKVKSLLGEFQDVYFGRKVEAIELHVH